MTLTFKQFLVSSAFITEQGGNSPPGLTAPSGWSGWKSFGAALGTIQPASEWAATISGRLSGLGFTDQGAIQRFNTYKGITDIPAKLAASGIASGVGSGGAGDMFAKLINTGAGAGSDEAATLMTSALYDPRAAASLSYTTNQTPGAGMTAATGGGI